MKYLHLIYLYIIRIFQKRRTVDGKYTQKTALDGTQYYWPNNDSRHETK